MGVQHDDIDHTGVTGVPTSLATDTLWDAKGDTVAATGANAAARVAVGANWTKYVANSAGASGVAWSGGHGCILYNTGAQTMNGSGTNSGNTAVTFDSEEHDTDAYHDTGSNTHLITIPAGLGGIYLVRFELWGTSGAPSTGTVADIWVNGATPSGAHRGVRAVNYVISIQTVWSVSTILKLSATNTINVNVNNPNAATFTVGHASADAVRSNFSAWLLDIG